MFEAIALLHWAQIVLLAASLPLALVAAWGFHEAPVGRAVAALPAISAGFLVAATAQLFGAGGAEAAIVWHGSGALGAVGFAWFALAVLHLVSGRRRVGE